MFILDGKVLLPDVPFTHNGVDYAATWLRNTTLEEKMAIGVIEKTEPVYDQRFYWGYDSDDNLIPKDHNELIKLWVSQTRITAGTLLQPTDWMIIREIDNGTAIDAVWKEWRQSIRLVANEKVLYISTTTNTDELAAYITGSDYPVWTPEPTTDSEINT